MLTKAERTTQYILETVAPIFNKKGYFGTSMSDLTAATGLTKGSIYGNFENKEQLALEAFNYNVRKVNGLLKKHVGAHENAKDKLFALTEFYRGYRQYTGEFGGCPLINVGVDSAHQNPVLANRVKHVVHKWKESLSRIIEEGIKEGYFRKSVKPGKLANLIFGMIEGGAFLTVIADDKMIMIDMMNEVDQIIERDLIK